MEWAMIVVFLAWPFAVGVVFGMWIAHGVVVARTRSFNAERDILFDQLTDASKQVDYLTAQVSGSIGAGPLRSQPVALDDNTLRNMSEALQAATTDRRATYGRRWGVLER